SGYWDINDKKRKLATTRIVDCGDVDVAYYDIERNMRLMTESARAILDRKALPVILGGDHSVTFPLVRAFERFAPLDIVHFDLSGYWDINDKKRKLATTRIVDCGDVDVAYYDIERNMRLMTESARAILDRKALPVILGGDHSVTFPLVRAFERFAPLDIVHFD